LSSEKRVTDLTEGHCLAPPCTVEGAVDQVTGTLLSSETLIVVHSFFPLAGSAVGDSVSTQPGHKMTGDNTPHRQRSTVIPEQRQRFTRQPIIANGIDNDL
jgi:hypothetical protein